MQNEKETVKVSYSQITWTLPRNLPKKKKKSLPIRYEFRKVTVHMMIVFVFILVEKLNYDTKGRNVTYSNIRKIK